MLRRPRLTVEPVSSRVDEPEVADSTRDDTELLRHRYGSSRSGTGRLGAKPVRWRVWLYTAVAITAGCLIAWIGYKNLGAAPIDIERIGFVEKSDSSMEITFRVTRDDPGKAGVCIVRTRDLTGAENGRREVLIPPGNTSTVLTSLIKTAGKAVTADTYGCSYTVPPYLVGV
jgi:hypothetical protein